MVSTWVNHAVKARLHRDWIATYITAEDPAALGVETRNANYIQSQITKITKLIANLPANLISLSTKWPSDQSLADHKVVVVRWRHHGVTDHDPRYQKVSFFPHTDIPDVALGDIPTCKMVVRCLFLRSVDRMVGIQYIT